MQKDIYFRIGLKAIERQKLLEAEKRKKLGFYDEDGEYLPLPNYKKYSYRK